ncbi:GNAT family N-acetyltransferase [Pseudobacillus badius]|uniref:GNAT family N-acetyltransferase n=1 Tax=Bacillus badius TaxID=1455 RepID=UPI0007B05AF6|nr:GNAT family N-acetyltransferase [Bacillus badius]KZO00362.1 acetyltransferase [Bacillus badius]MED0668420.1 GNAT family N-acetyltransferase [Bacillus badius]OCS86529.1 acetyltransferase [Bacillus badius]OVE52008.1 N-acetyltransferase [Bacillus badius]TDW03705.1 GNAT family acetyltransferase [Bacillus badius]
MNVYQVTQEDVRSVAELFDAYRVFYEQPSNKEAAESFIRERLEKEESVIFMAVENGQSIGFTQLYPTFSSVAMKRVWILNDLFVTADSRNKGAGRALLQAAKQFAKETGAKGLQLQTAVDNKSAQHLYESDGWVKDEKFFYYEFKL